MMIQRTIIKRKDAAIHSFTVNHNGKELTYKVQEPTFEQISAGLTESVGMTGKLNMAGGGKVIWELCVFEFDEEIEKDARLLLSVCIALYNDFVIPADAEIKKN